MVFLGKGLHSCDVCSKQFYCLSEMESHRRNHKEFHPFLCDLCGQTFATDDQLNRHVNKHVIPHSEERFTCDICSNYFTTKESIAGHMRSHIFGNLVCEEDDCGQRFDNRKDFAKHMLRHKPLSCTSCSYVTTSQYTLTVHMRSHTGDI